MAPDQARSTRPELRCAALPPCSTRTTLLPSPRLQGVVLARSCGDKELEAYALPLVRADDRVRRVPAPVCGTGEANEFRVSPGDRNEERMGMGVICGLEFVPAKPQRGNPWSMTFCL